MVLTPGARGLEQEQGVPRASGSGARTLVMGTAPSRDSDRVRAKLPAIKGSGCHLVPVICGPAAISSRDRFGSAPDGPVTAQPGEEGR